ncbi:DUF6030 family protein [Aureimonas sp. SK2]|uniref:DUF6030 family protein n=1 Tax=Aureimonas sp. SK2 TaxID=3015992 RepID=UPI002443B69B|nr:DUF6030 family protein [Aureimonas sp. SK2]
MNGSGDEDRAEDGRAGALPIRSAQALARTRALIEARRERDAIRLRNPGLRNDDARRLMREASAIAVAAGLAMESEARDPQPAAPEPESRSRRPASGATAFGPSDFVPPAAPPEPDAAPEPPAAVSAAREPEPLAVALASRWEEPARSRFRRHLAKRFAFGMAGADLARAGLAAAVVAAASGALYAGLLAVQPTEPEPPIAEREPPVLELRPTPVRTIRIAAPREPAAAPAVPADLSLRGGIPSFAQVVPGAPAEACATLVAAGWSTEGWGSSLVGAKGECLAERQYGTGGETNGFAVLRGGNTLAELRIKLNLGDPAWRAEAGRDAGNLVAALFERWRWDGGRALGDRIATLLPFEDEANGTTIRLTREHGDVERLNLLMRFPRALPPPEAVAAEAQAARLAALSAIVAAHVGGTEGLAQPVEPEPTEP